MKKKWIVTSIACLALSLPIGVSASESWRGADSMTAIERNVYRLDELLTEKDEKIRSLENQLAELQNEPTTEVPQETIDKATAFDSVAQAIEKRTGFQVTVENYEHLMSKTIELLDQKNGIAKQLIKWVFG